MPLVTRLSAGCRRKCVIGSPWAHCSAWASDKIQNKTHSFSKREQISSSAYHKRPGLMQPVFRAYSTSCQMGRGLAGHPQCVRVGNGYNKTRLFTPIHSKTTTLLRSSPAHKSCPAHRGNESQTPESRPGKKIVQDDHIEADPLANMPRGLVHITGSERRILSHPGSGHPHHRRFLRFTFESCI